MTRSHRTAAILRGRGPAASRLPLVALAALAAFAGAAQALGLGEVSQQSAFGTALRVVVPVIAATAEELAGECVKLVPAARGGDGIPEVLNARIALERTASGVRIVVLSPRAVADPVLKLTLQAGCDSAVRREYVLLMDPPPIDVPVAQVGGVRRSDGATRAPESAPAFPAAGSPGAATSAPAAATAPRAAARRRATAAARASGAARSRPATSAPRSGAATATATPKVAPATPKAAAAPTTVPGAARPQLTVSAAAPAVVRPQLTVSAAAPAVVRPQPAASAAAPAAGSAVADSPPPAPAGGTGFPASPAAPAPADASAALDAEAAALQQRVAELTAMVDRMQQEMRAADAPPVVPGAAAAAGNIAKAGPQATLGRWWNDAWPLLVGVVVLAGLIAALLSYRRRRTSEASRRWHMEAPSQGGAAPPQAGRRPAPVVPAPPPTSVAAASAKPPGTVAPTTATTTATTVDVAELSHVTEEAGVYLAFDRPDRAIEVLDEHIRATPRSQPAAWLMLLDLYHAQGLAPEFRDLGQRFHARFNVQTPVWDGYRQQTPGDRGIEALPHVVRQLVAAWGKPEVRELLDHLLHENRDGRRTGFSLPAYEDILFLRQLADATSGGDGAPRAVPRTQPAAPASADAARRTAAAGPADRTGGPRRPPTPDLQLALDEDMLNGGKSQSPGASPPPAKNPPKES